MKKLVILALAAVAGSASASLWDNGPIATNTLFGGSGAAAPNGGQWSELQTVGGVTDTTLGVGLAWTGAAGTGVRVADDFTVGAGGWDITSVDAFGYLTGATTPGITAAFLEIWNGNPMSGGAVIYGDTTTNVLAAGSNTFANIYRTANTAAGTTRNVQNFRMNAVTHLNAGTYWVDYGITGASFCPPVTIPGQLGKTGANAVQFQSTLPGWVAVTDVTTGATPVAQDMPFVINGTPTPEPATIAALGLGAIVLIRRRRKA